jgi:hypothetical protein
MITCFVDATNVQIEVFWDHTPCVLVNKYRCFKKFCAFEMLSTMYGRNRQ